jgi:hypothetical protein
MIVRNQRISVHIQPGSVNLCKHLGQDRSVSLDKLRLDFGVRNTIDFNLPIGNFSGSIAIPIPTAEAILFDLIEDDGKEGIVGSISIGNELLTISLPANLLCQNTSI